MIKLTATVFKELLLLARDRSGMLVLFFMPAALVVVISLVQENVLKTTGESDIGILFIDRDLQSLGRIFEEQLQKSASVKIIRQIGGQELTEDSARKLVADGDFQICIVIQEGLSEAVQKQAVRQIRSSFASEKTAQNHPDEEALPGLTLYFDPMIQGSFRSAMINALHRMTLAIEMEIKAGIISEVVPAQIRSVLQTASPYGMDFSEETPLSVDSLWGQKRIMEIRTASEEGMGKLPTSVQQNVPAWALFGMFFIVVPLGGSIIREKQEGTLVRLLTLPVPYLTILSGKIIAYVLVCVIQFGIILLMGKHILPLLGTPVLEMGSSPFAIAAVVICSALAASGYGVMLGTVARTYEQASMFGPVSVVIAAALGGIMVPVYVMPRMMQQISHFSPLAWGLNALTDIFVRGGNIKTVLPELLLLLSFFSLNMFIAWAVFIRRGRSGT
ncbi:MAG: ABC transporter permease [Desulfococcaceae bacterium]